VDHSVVSGETGGSGITGADEASNFTPGSCAGLTLISVIKEDASLAFVDDEDMSGSSAGTNGVSHSGQTI
jgi:hypothetical protein